jgi:hypothetical protein
MPRVTSAAASRRPRELRRSPCPPRDVVDATEGFDLVGGRISEELDRAARGSVKRAQCFESTVLNLIAVRINVFTDSSVDDILLRALQKVCR